MPLDIIPAMAGINVRFAVDLLEVAEFMLHEAQEAVRDTETETAIPDLAAMRAACRVALAMLRPAADTVRVPMCLDACRRSVLDREEDARNPPGLERAAIALAFASAALDEAADELTEGDWFDRCAAFAHVFCAMHSQIETSLFRRRTSPGDECPGMN